MRVRVRGALPDGADNDHAASLMLSPGDGPGDGTWCRVDAGRAAQGDASAGVVLTGAQREQVGGLLDLRHGAPIDLYATPAVFEHLTQALPLLPVLQQFCGVQWHLIPVAGEQHAADFTVDALPQLGFTALTSGEAAAGERIALAVRDQRSGSRLFVVHGASLEAGGGEVLLDWMRDADCVVIDRAPHGARWLDLVARSGVPRRLLLDANGSEHRALIAASGIECAVGEMEFEL
jgi:pyrroloquinoline quinone biosynthesis protein B